jgi:hypothetical protein
MIKFKTSILGLVLAFTLSFSLNSCNNNNVTGPSQTEDEYLRNEAVNNAFSTNQDDEDNLFATEATDFDNEGAVSDNIGDLPLDSLKRYGRRVSNVNFNSDITITNDTLKTVLITRTITGYFILIGYRNGALDSVSKPYTQEQKRIVTFRRIARTNNHRSNWRVYTFTAADGKTLTPQNGKNNITISRAIFYRNGNPIDTLYGPDFTVNVFKARLFWNGNIINAGRNDNVNVKIFLNSNQSDTDIVAFHWGRNSFGFHREKFQMISQVQNGNTFDRVYEKTFNIYNLHRYGIFNGYISANTRSSIWDDNINLFSSTYFGFPYIIRP